MKQLVRVVSSELGADAAFVLEEHAHSPDAISGKALQAASRQLLAL